MHVNKEHTCSHKRCLKFSYLNFYIPELSSMFFCVYNQIAFLCCSPCLYFLLLTREEPPLKTSKGTSDFQVMEIMERT